MTVPKEVRRDAARAVQKARHEAKRIARDGSVWPSIGRDLEKIWSFYKRYACGSPAPTHDEARDIIQHISDLKAILQKTASP